MNNRTKKVFKGILTVALLVAILLSFPPVANAVAKVTGKPLEATKNAIVSTARVIVAVLVGVALIWAGVAFAAGAVLFGAVLVVAGVGLIIYAVWPLFFKGKTEKPDNVQLRPGESPTN